MLRASGMSTTKPSSTPSERQMTEADEVAANLRPMFVAVIKPENRCNMDTARRFVREWMPGESVQVIDNVAEALTRKDRADAQIRREKHETPQPY